ELLNDSADPDSSFGVLTETEAITIAIDDFEIAAAVRLIADVSCDGDAPRFELGVKRVGAVDPHVRIPGIAVRVGNRVGTHDAGRTRLAQHDDDAASLHHAKTGRLAPE